MIVANPTSRAGTDAERTVARRDLRDARHLSLAAGVGAMALLLILQTTSTVVNLTLLVTAYVGFAVVLVTQLRDPWLERRTVLWTAGGLLLLAVVAPPLESRDLWAYAMYGRVLGVHHASPYTHLPASFTGDPFLGSMDPQWHHTASVYGPLFSGLSGLGAALAGNSTLAARLVFQVLAAASVGAVLLLLDRRRAGVAALVVVGLNPLVILAVVNSGHNDALVGLGLLAGVLLTLSGRHAWAGVAFAAAILVKLSAALAVVAALTWLWRRHGLRAVLATAWVLTALVIGSLALAGGSDAVAPLQHAQLRQTASSIWFAPREALIDHDVAAGEAPGAADAEARELIAKLAEVVVGATAVAVVLRRRRDPSLPAVVGAVLLSFALVGANFLPWYWAWGLPVLALMPRSRLTWLALAQGALLDVAMFPVAVGAGGASVLEHAQAWLRDVGMPLVQLAMLVALFALRPGDGAESAPAATEDEVPERSTPVRSAVPGVIAVP